MNEYPQLVNLANNDSVHINSNRFSVGRSLANNYILNSAFASRTQFILENRDGLWSLEDKSTNGTRLNNSHIRKGEALPIEHGDVLKFQDIVLRFVTSAAEVPPLDDSVEIINDDDNPPENNRNGSDGESAGMSERGRRRAHDNLAGNAPEEPSPKKSKQNDHNQDSSMEEDLHCSICSELFVKAITLDCCHTFCSFCINYWKAKSPVCPICRQVIGAMAPTLVLDNYIEKLVARMDDEAKEQRKEIIKQRSQMGTYAAYTAPMRSLARNNVVNPIASIVVSSDEESGGDDLTDDDELHFEDIVPYTGRRGYYGGYGRCYNCHRRGHWSNQCPFH